MNIENWFNSSYFGGGGGGSFLFIFIFLRTRKLFPNTLEDYGFKKP